MSKQPAIYVSPCTTSIARGDYVVAQVTPAPPPPQLVTVRDVEICSTGIEYPLASGPQTFTEEDLVDAVAAQDDPSISSPRIWLGHPDDDRFHAGRTTPAGSAEPALGKVINMRLSADRQTVIGDLVGVPRWLGDIVASAYPARSIEGFMGAETVTGKTWRLVITDLALLGVTWPGVSTLEDLQMLYSETGPDGVEIVQGGVMAGIRAASAVQAGVNVDDVRRQYYDQLTAEQLWWWVRAVYLDPNELIVDDDDGGLFRVPFTVDGDDISFQEAQSVKIEYVNTASDKKAAARAVALVASAGKLLAAYSTRAVSRPDSTTQEDSGMTPEQIRLLRARLGLSEEQLPDDATPEQINAALAEQPQPPDPPDPPNPNPTTPPDSNTAPAPPSGDPPQPAEPQPQPTNAARTVTVSAEAWELVQRQAASGAAVAERSEAQRRSDVIANAVREGRIAPAQRQNFTAMWSRDPEGTERLLTAAVADGGLMPGTIPVSARGVDPSPGDLQTEAYPASWLPELAGNGASPITQEG